MQNLTVSGTVSGSLYVGGVVGLNSGTVENCYNIGKVSGTGVGGVVGWNDSGTVKNCYNIGDVSGNYVGGVVGQNSSGDSSGDSSASVTNCYNTGEVSGGEDVGGVVGNNSFNATVTNCYNTGNVSGPDSGSDNNVGGVVGYNSSSVTNCYFLQTTGVNENLSGIGGGSAEGAKSLTADQFKKQENFTNWDFGSTNTWTIHPVLGRPVLNENLEGGDGSPDSPYEISTADELKNFATAVNGANDQTADPDAHAKLMNDINLSSVCGESNSWNPIGSSSNEYTGNFNGQNFKISGLYIKNTSSDTDYQGPFGYLGTSGDNKGTVQNLTVSGDISGDMYVGGVVGYNNGGTVTGCTFSGSGTVSGGMYVGGVVGDNNGGTVENCHNIGEVSGNRVGGVVGYNNGGTVKNCYNAGKVSGLDSGSGNRYVGGVVGLNGNGSVENCYNTGNVSVTSSDISNVGGVVGYNGSSSTVTNCYNTGSVTRIDSTYVGGVVGWNDGANVTNCYFLQGTAESGIGKNEGSATATEKDDTAFHSGEVAWLLENGQAEDQTTPVWGQSDLTTPDSWPTLVALDKDAKTVYQVTLKYDYAGAQDKTYYTDDTATPSEQPSRDGYTFDHWDKTEGEGNTITYTAKWTPHTYSITASPSALDFGSITEGEERPAAQEVTITNTGNQTVTLNPPAAENFEIGTLSAKELKPDESATFTIQPKENLPRGSYSEQIAISNTNGEKAAITATFTVKEPPYTGKYSYEVSTSVGDHGSLTVDRYATEGEKVTITVTPDEAYKLDDLTVTAHGKDVELTANSDGTYTFTMPSADVRITATFAEDPDWTPDEPEEPTTDVSDLFIDVAPNAWYKDAVQYAYDSGLMTGVSANEFAPEATTTRAMIVSILARLEGVTTAEAAGFADVDDNDWYATAVNWAANVGVVNGYEDNTFQPNTAITREQLAAILMNYAAYKGEDVSNRADLTSYTDQPSTWAEEAISWSVAEGLLTGVTADTLQPQGAATRAQVAAILQRFLSE